MRHVYLFLVLLLLAGCARIVVPTGGPKDSAPPVINAEYPENRNVHFNGKTIRLGFNEYVVLDNPLENIIFSPPLSSSPDFSIKNKTVIIQLKDTLLPNKTYNVIFSNAIKDFTEGNFLPFHQYTFSTGSSIDSFKIDGWVKNAETSEAEEGVYIFLYDQDIDSLPLTSRPTYLTKTRKGGHFSFQNIQEGDYKIFALRDINNNLLYDLPNEKIAFLNSPVRSVKMQIDSSAIATDSLQEKDEGIGLWIFMAEDTLQQLLKPLNPAPGIYKIIYKRPFKTFNAIQLYPDLALEYTQLLNPGKDTVTWYFKYPLVDTPRYLLSIDSDLVDTATLAPYKQIAQRGGFAGRESRKKSSSKLSVTYANAGDIYSPITLRFASPVLPLDSFPVTLIKNAKNDKDTLTYFFSIPDTFILSLPLHLPIEEKVSYTLIIRDSLFSNYAGETNDSIRISFTTKSEKDYGNLMMEYIVEKTGVNYIVNLLTTNNAIVQEHVIDKTTKITYSHLKPGDYKIKIVEDRNKNGKWDTGNYHQKEQPERVLFFNKPVTIRGYWDLEETLDIEKIKTGSKH